MDQNSVAPFPMYSDEVILWMEQRKREKISKKDIITFCGVATAAVISVFLLLLLVSKTTLLISVLTPFIFIVIPCIFGVTVTGKIYIRKSFYYVTNYRLIHYIQKRKPRVKYGYINNLEDAEITEFDNGQKSIEFEWNNQDIDFGLCYGFFYIEKAEDVYKLIFDQKAELENNFETYDFVIQ